MALLLQYCKGVVVWDGFGGQSKHSTGGRFCLHQRILYCLLAVGEDAAELELHERQGQITERTQRQAVANMVADAGAVFGGLETVSVNPEGIRALYLLVREGVRGIPFAYKGTPLEGHSKQLKTIIDQGANLHRHWGRVENPKLKLGGSNPLEVLSLAEKLENRVQIQRQLNFGVQIVFHRILSICWI